MKKNHRIITINISADNRIYRMQRRTDNGIILSFKTILYI